MKSSIIVVGTSHISIESLNQVKETIEKNAPAIIALELDRNRFNSILSPQRPSMNPFKVGVKFWIINNIGAFIEKKLGQKAGLEPGSEMKTAIKIAREKQLKIALIDQDIRITLNRLTSKFTLKEKINFALEVLKTPFATKQQRIKINLKKVPSDELIDLVITEVKKKFPTIYEVLINERNIYMANKLKLLKAYHPDETIIAIVGAGHKKGIEELLKGD